jgi:hypothetical protein
MEQKPGPIVIALCAVAALAAVGAPLAAQSATLPFGKSQVADPSALPPPVGLGITIYDQRQDYQISSLTFSAPALPGVALGSNDDLDIQNRITEYNVKLDAWLLPYLNVFGIIGQVDGTTRVDFTRAGLPLPFDRLTINYDGTVYGAGATLAGGNEHYFASLTAIATETDLSGDFDSSAQALVLTPKVGLHDDRGAFWIGAMYQDAEETHSGTLSVPFVGAVDFDVDLQEKDNWNLLLGISGALGAHWVLEMEGGFGGREYSTLALTYRF